MPNCVFVVFYEFLALSRIKWFKLGLFPMKLGTQLYLVYIIVFKWLESKTIVICLKLRAKLPILGFLSVFGTFTHRVVKTWFVWDENWHMTLFRIYYCVEIFRIQNNSHMLEITC